MGLQKEIHIGKLPGQPFEIVAFSIHETVPVEVQFCAGIVEITTLALLATEWYGVSRSPSKP